MVGILVSFWDGIFSGAMLVSGRVVADSTLLLILVVWKLSRQYHTGTGLRAVAYHGGRRGTTRKSQPIHANVRPYTQTQTYHLFHPHPDYVIHLPWILHLPAMFFQKGEWYTNYLEGPRKRLHFSCVKAVPFLGPLICLKVAPGTQTGKSSCLCGGHLGGFVCSAWKLSSRWIQSLCGR